MQSRIMYIEFEGNNALSGPARIGRVTFSRSGHSIYYKGKQFARLMGRGFNLTIMMLRRATFIGFPDAKGAAGTVFIPAPSKSTRTCARNIG